MIEKHILYGEETYNLAPFKYEWAYTMAQHSLANHWTPNEVSMGREKLCYEQELTADEQFMFKHVFATLTTADLAIQENLTQRVYGLVKAAEIKLYIARQIAEEGLHSVSYQHVIEVLGFDQEETYSLYRRTPAISEWFAFAKSMTEAEDILMPLIFYYAIFEGVFFPTAFAAIYSLQRRRLMVGTGEQIQYIHRDECVSEDTEVLTPEGWVFVPEVTPDTQLAQWHEDSGELSFTKPTALSANRQPTAYRFKSKSNLFDQLVSPNHRMVYLTKNGNVKVVRAEEATPNPYSKFISTGVISGGVDNCKLTAQERLRIAVQADANLNQRSQANDTFTFSLKKERKIRRLKEILDECGVMFSETGPDKRGFTCIRFLQPHGTISKDFDWLNLEGVSASWCRAFIEEVVEWDGHRRAKEEGGDIVYCSTNKSCVDKVQAVATLAGYRTILHVTKDNRKATYKDYYRVTVHREHKYVSGGCVEKEEVLYDGVFYGIQVPSSFILIRRNGAVSVTGNSMHVGFGIRLIKEIIREIAEKPAEVDVHRLFVHALNKIEAWARHCIPDVLGYSANLHIQHSKYLADKRLKQLGYNPVFFVEEALPWLDEQASIKKEKNFFETRVTDYQSGGALKFDDGPTGLDDLVNWK